MARFKALKADEGKRADVFVAAKLPKFSRSTLKGLFRRSLVTINGRSFKPGHRLHRGDSLEVDTALLETEPAAVDIPVIYEDKDVMVLNKPAGMLTHAKGALNEEASVASFIKPKITDKDLIGNRAGIVHRLDRPTSGLIIVAKHSNAQKELQKQFSNRKAKKLYWAVVTGKPTPESAVIDAPINRNPRRPQSFRVNAGGKPAQTEYSVIKTFKSGNKTYSLVGLKPLTGRTHQIRVHMAYIGHPLLGDAVYGPKADSPMYLHAKELTITLPSGKTETFRAELPSTFQEFIK